MKKSTKFWLGVSAVGGGIWAWMKYGSSEVNARVLQLKRTPIPGYTSATNVFDANRKPGIRYVYPAGLVISGITLSKPRAFFVPADPTQFGVWSDA